jgi:CRISPR-associated protein Cmr4
MSYLQADFYTIDCLTNTLAGSGKANYGVIDQLVQRDAATHIPVINASGLKGAIKEFCTHDGLDEGVIKKVFGSVKPKKEEEKKDDDTATGLYKFMDAHLLCIPVRSDKRACVHITCPQVLENLHNHLKLFGKEKLCTELNSVAALIANNESTEAVYFDNALMGAILEDFEFTASTESSVTLSDELKNLFAHEIVLVSNQIFNTLTNDLHLPVIARNHLENGESENLWYEQVIPRKSRFWFALLKPESEKEPLFDNKMVADRSIIQIGANATVGYGYTKINTLNC